MRGKARERALLRPVILRAEQSRSYHYRGDTGKAQRLKRLAPFPPPPTPTLDCEGTEGDSPFIKRERAADHECARVKETQRVYLR